MYKYITNAHTIIMLKNLIYCITYILVVKTQILKYNAKFTVSKNTVFLMLVAALRFGDMMLKFGSRRLNDVTDGYEHALFGRFPRARYAIGKDVKFIYLPLAALPEWLSDFLLDVL